MYPFITLSFHKDKNIRSNIQTVTHIMLVIIYKLSHIHWEQGRVAQSVTCLATDACLTADPGVASSIPARYHTFVEIDHEIISTVILLPSAVLFKKGCCQLQAKVCAQITGYSLAQACPGKVWLSELTVPQ